MSALENVKAIIASRTIWTIVAIVVIGLFGINLQEIPNAFTNHESTRLALSVALVVCGFFGIWFRVKAQHKLHKTPYDSALLTLMALPMCLCLALGNTGCSRAANTPLDTAKITVATLNDMYIPARQIYEQFYNAAPEDTKLILNRTVNPAVNKANNSLVKLTSMVIAWASEDKMPDGYEGVKAEAEKDLADAVKAMSQAQDNPE